MFRTLLCFFLWELFVFMFPLIGFESKIERLSLLQDYKGVSLCFL